MTSWRWPLGTIFHLSISSPLFLTFPFPFILFSLSVYLFTRHLEYITWVLGYIPIFRYKIKILLNVIIDNIIVDPFVWNVLLGITLVSNLIELGSDNTLTLLRLMTQWFTRQGTFTGKWILVIVLLNNENNNLYTDPQSPTAKPLFLLCQCPVHKFSVTQEVCSWPCCILTALHWN